MSKFECGVTYVNDILAVSVSFIIVFHREVPTCSHNAKSMMTDPTETTERSQFLQEQRIAALQTIANLFTQAKMD